MFKREGKNHLYFVKNLDNHVLVVASLDTISKLWCAYIGSVLGIDHYIEWEKVRDYGTRLDYNIAKVLFPKTDKEYTWRL